MLYLEDYLELIEHLPLELRDRLTDIRERDLQVHNSAQQLKERVKRFFASASQLEPEKRQCELENILKEYDETMKYADDKVQIAAQMHTIMVKLVQRLDTELEKFKLELEADHVGITEELERRSLELDADSRLDDIINGHLRASTNGASDNRQFSSTPSIRTPSVDIKNRRRSEHKHRHHPYHKSYLDGYQRASGGKLSHHDHHHQSTNKHHHLQHGQPRANGSKSSAASVAAGHITASTSAPPSIAGSYSGSGTSNGPNDNNMDLIANNSSFKNPSNTKAPLAINGTIVGTTSQHHPALSAALASNGLSYDADSVTAPMSSLTAHQFNHHTTISNNLKASDLNQDPIAAAASQAIAATQQLQQGRRTPSLKASFAAISAAGLGPLDALSSKDSTGATGRNALAPVTPDQQAFRHNHFGKNNSSANSTTNGTSSPIYVSVTKSGRPTKRPKHHASHIYPDESPTSISSDNSVFENSESISSTDFIEAGRTFGSASPSSLDFATNTNSANTTLYVRDETKYCICRQISYGLMVACDNVECEIEWFHYDCVGVTQKPKGKWFCPDCTRKMSSQPHQIDVGSQQQTQKKRGRKEKSIFNLVNSSIDGVKTKN